MKTITFILSIALLVSCATAHSLTRQAPHIDPSRTVKILDKIDIGSLKNQEAAMLDMAMKSHDPINVIINSPGGELDTTYEFIQLMDDLKTNGISIRCYVPEYAASAAFAIFTHCSSRYALNTASLLWHQARAVGLPDNLPPEVIEQVRQELLGVNAAMAQDLLNTLGKYMDHQTLLGIFQLQVMHGALMLDRLAPGFMHVYPKIPGLMEMLPAKAKK